MYGCWARWLRKVNFLSRSLGDSRAIRSDNKSLQFGSCCWGFQVQMRHWHKRFGFPRRCAVDWELGPQRRPRLLHGALGREYRLAIRRAEWVLWRVLRPVRLSRPNRAILALGCDAATCPSDLEVWNVGVRGILCRWDAHQRAHQDDCLQFDIGEHHDSNGSATLEYPYEVRQSLR